MQSKGARREWDGDWREGEGDRREPGRKGEGGGGGGERDRREPGGRRGLISLPDSSTNLISVDCIRCYPASHQEGPFKTVYMKVLSFTELPCIFLCWNLG